LYAPPKALSILMMAHVEGHGITQRDNPQPATIGGGFCNEQTKVIP
jgi:hypothetical protein